MNKLGMNKWDAIGLLCSGFAFVLGAVGTIAGIKSSSTHMVENAAEYNRLTGRAQNQTLKK